MSFTESSMRQINLFNQHTAAERIGVDVRTLRRWHRQGIGPTRQNIEHRKPILYSRVEVEQFAATYNWKPSVQTPANGHFEIGLCNDLQTDV